VSAASICAKVTRDHVIRDWKFAETGLEEAFDEEDLEDLRAFGSGYPGDPKTKKWLDNNVNKVFGFPRIIRFSWATCENFLEKNAYNVKWPCDEEDEEGQQKVTSYFKKRPLEEDSEAPATPKEKLWMTKYANLEILTSF
jgi:ribonuclease H2 subunit A